MIKDTTTNIVFLHIPKTAGQTIHTELARVVGARAVSPIRVHTQAGPGKGQFPPGYRLYSGHIDWVGMEQAVPEPRFVFTVLRDPLERIASFYFYLRRQAEELSEEELALPQRAGMRMALNHGPDEYFFGGTLGWLTFVRDHYHSPYCVYLATRKIRGFLDIDGLPPQQVLDRALAAAEKLDGVYSVDRLDLLERDVKDRLGAEINVTGRYVNADPSGQTKRRWPRLEAMVEKEETLAKLMRFARLDQMLMYRLGMGPKPGPLPPLPEGS